MTIDFCATPDACRHTVPPQNWDDYIGQACHDCVTAAAGYDRDECPDLAQSSLDAWRDLPIGTTLTLDGESLESGPEPHFGNSPCIVCGYAALAGDRFDATLTIWRT